MTDPRTLTIDLGGKWHQNYGVAPCPVCQPERRRDQTALTVSDGDGKLLLHCKRSGCDFRDILAAAGIQPGQVECDFEAITKSKAEREAADAKRLARARSIWDHAKPIGGTRGEAYLRSRGIVSDMPESLRWLPDTYHQPSGRYCSAMVANVSTGGIHRTFFDKQTGERLGQSAKMMLGPCQGGAVVLAEAIGPLVVAEGIETGLSLACGLLSGPATIWAALSTSGIKGLRLPERPGQLIIAADGDPAGQAAGCDMASRASRLGWDVSLMPAPEGQDWNDVLQAAGVAA